MSKENIIHELRLKIQMKQKFGWKTRVKLTDE